MIRNLCAASWTLLLLLAACAVGCTQGSNEPRVAFVTNGAASFWQIAKVGAEAGAKESNVRVEVRFPGDSEKQQQTIEDLLTVGIKGIAISPIDPANQQAILNKAAAQTKLITQDSDAPESNRLCYVGMNNYDAGRMCGKLVKEALPEGGTIMIFIGRVGQLNADLRRQGVIDEVCGWSHDDTRRTSPDEEAASDDGKYKILGTKLDNGLNADRTKENAEAVLVNHPDISCFVGLFAYNPPALLQALKDRQMLGKVQVVGFDEEDPTLQGIIDGHVYGTVVQNPYEYGRQSVKILAALAKGDDSVIPKNKMVNIEARSIKKDNVEEFWKDLKAKVEAGK